MIFLAILIPAILEGITLSTRASLLAERGAVAAELAQNKLGELTLNDAWMSGETGGNFGPDWPGIRWESEHATWEMDAMEQLTVRAYFKVQGREKCVTLSTLVSSGTSITSGTLSTTSASSTPSGGVRK